MDFVDAYGSFSPGIDSTDIATLIANLEGITDAACDELNEDDSIVGVGISTVAVLAGYCTGTTIFHWDYSVLDSILRNKNGFWYVFFSVRVHHI